MDSDVDVVKERIFLAHLEENGAHFLSDAHGICVKAMLDIALEYLECNPLEHKITENDIIDLEANIDELVSSSRIFGLVRDAMMDNHISYYPWKSRWTKRWEKEDAKKKLDILKDALKPKKLGEKS